MNRKTKQLWGLTVIILAGTVLLYLVLGWTGCIGTYDIGDQTYNINTMNCLSYFNPLRALAIGCLGLMTLGWIIAA